MRFVSFREGTSQIQPSSHWTMMMGEKVDHHLKKSCGYVWLLHCNSSPKNWAGSTCNLLVKISDVRSFLFTRNVSENVWISFFFILLTFWMTKFRRGNTEKQIDVQYFVGYSMVNSEVYRNRCFLSFCDFCVFEHVFPAELCTVEVSRDRPTLIQLKILRDKGAMVLVKF